MTIEPPVLLRNLRGAQQLSREAAAICGPGRANPATLNFKPLALAVCVCLALPAVAAGPVTTPTYKVLPAVVRGNLAIYPIVSARSYDTKFFLTLDEGIRSGQVTIAENGDRGGLVHPGHAMPPRQQGAEVNRLVLYNDSDRPLLLLAGEIVTGGKQDRIIGSDRIIPAKTGPIDLSVFCVEPERWTGATSTFGSLSRQMAQPGVRAPAMVQQDQSMVWDSVRSSNAKAEAQLSGAGAASVHGTSSYAGVFASPPVQKIIGDYGGTQSEQVILKELRDQGAVGVVVAVDGRVLWADVFANTDLLAKYWPKLMSSYVAEAVTAGAGGAAPSAEEAEAWMNQLNGEREVAETEANVYRRTDITGAGYRVLELESLLPGTEFPVHVTKIREQNNAETQPWKDRGILR